MNKRKFKRTRLDKLPVIFSLPGQIKGPALKTFFLRDLSFGGAYLLTSEEVPLESEAVMEFILPFNELSLMAEPKITFEIRGIVQRKGDEGKEEPGIGIRFQEKPKVMYNPIG